ncbi:MAG: serine hydrolase [Candidatus Moraniibacteriota bacterium]
MNLRLLVSVFAIFATGVIAGFFLYSLMEKKSAPVAENASKQVRQIGSYQYINPLLECEVAEGSIDARKENFRDELDRFIVGLKKDKSLTDAAVYFRDLNNGPTFGINDQAGFFPASLLKVPILMAYYHVAERDPFILKDVIRFEVPRDFGPIHQSIVPQKELVSGEVYSVEELIQRMIVYSDNQAAFLLANSLPKTDFESLFGMLGLDRDTLEKTGAKLTVKEYASFFRILFNSSYLSSEYSEKVLKLLTETDFSGALKAGVPEDVSVSHKFGEAGTGDIERQLHDCGIVYFPNHPYLACIMTRGKDTDELKKSIVDISRFIYEKIDEQY